jgi:hypothetical protein
MDDKKLDEIFYLLRDLPQLSPQAVLGSLYNVKPKDNIEHWSSAASHKFLSMVQDAGPLCATITKIDHEVSNLLFHYYNQLYKVMLRCYIFYNFCNNMQ